MFDLKQKDIYMLFTVAVAFYILNYTLFDEGMTDDKSQVLKKPNVSKKVTFASDVDEPSDMDTYKRSNYLTGDREQNTNNITKAYVPKQPNYKEIGDYLDSSKLLPDTNDKIYKSWSSVPKDLVTMDNRHLVGSIRMTGVNTINGNNKMPLYDIRRAPIIEKETSQWFNNSSFDQRIPLKKL